MLQQYNILLRWSEATIEHNKAAMSTHTSISPGYEHLSLDQSVANIEAYWPIRGQHYQRTVGGWVAHVKQDEIKTYHIKSSSARGVIIEDSNKISNETKKQKITLKLKLEN